MARKALRAAPGCKQASLRVGPYDPSHPVVPEIPVVGEFAAWGLWQALLEVLRRIAWFWNKVMPALAKNYIGKTAPGALLGPQRN